MDAIRKDVESLVKKELESANKMFPLFRSRHEGCAVIAEEIQESEFELESLNERFKAVWSFTKHDSYGENAINELRNIAVSLAIEAIQVAAMAQKFIDSEKARMEEELCKE